MDKSAMIIALIVAVVIGWPLLKKIFKSVKIEEMSSIHSAALYGDIKRIKYLINTGININSKDGRKRTPIMYVAEDGSIEIIKYFIKNGANINETDDNLETPLIIAIKNNNVGAAKYLIESETDINITNIEGKKALDIAKENKLYDIVKLLENKH